jgi:hypothetical protein
MTRGSEAWVTVSYGHAGDLMTAYCWTDVTGEAEWTSSDEAVVEVVEQRGTDGAEEQRLMAAGAGIATITVRYAGDALAHDIYVCEPSEAQDQYCADEPVGQRLVPGGPDPLHWEWSPDGTEVVFHLPPLDDPAPTLIEAAAVEDGAMRTILAADGSLTVEGLQVVDPYVYFLSGVTLYRVPLAGGAAAEPVLEVGEDVGPWTVSPDNERAALRRADGRIEVAELTPGTAPMVTDPRPATHRIFFAPAGRHILAVDSADDADAAPVFWMDLAADTSSTATVACGIGPAVTWDGAVPTIYGFCRDVAARQPLDGGSETLFTVHGDPVVHQWSDGAEWATTWTAVCDVFVVDCYRSDARLTVWSVDGTRHDVGTFTTHAVDPFSAFYPAKVDPTGARAAYVFLGHLWGLYVVELPE